MIDLIKQQFETLTAKYLKNEPDYDININLKIEHSIRVAELTEKIATLETRFNFDPELAYTAGLLHDIGRFEQYRRYASFNDRLSANHGELGYEMLKDSDMLVNTMPLVWREIVLAVTRTHNALKVPRDLNIVSREYVNLVRDADKIDVIRLFLKLFNEKKITECLVHKLPITDDYTEKLAHKLIKNKPILGKELKTVTDFKLLLLSWLKDINYSSSARIMIDEKLGHEIKNTLPKDQLIEDAYQAVLGSLKRKFSL